MHCHLNNLFLWITLASSKADVVNLEKKKKGLLNKNYDGKSWRQMVNNWDWLPEADQPLMFLKICVLKNFATLSEKQLCHSLFLIKLQVFRLPTILKRESNIGFFLWILQNFYEQLFIIEHLWWLLLDFADLNSDHDFV